MYGDNARIKKNLRKYKPGDKVYITGFPYFRNGDCGVALVTGKVDKEGNIKIFPLYDRVWQAWDLTFPTIHNARISLWKKGGKRNGHNV